MDQQSRNGGLTTGHPLLGSALALVGAATVGVGVAHCLGSDPALGAAFAGFVGNITANLGTDYLRRLRGSWLDRSRPVEENHVIIRTLRRAQLEALRDIANRFDRHRLTDQLAARRAQADRFAGALRAWLDAEDKRAPELTLDDLAEGDNSTPTGLRDAVPARLPAELDASLAARHGTGPARQRFGGVAEGAVLAELCAALPWDPDDLPPMFVAPFTGGRDGTDGWFALFIGKAARELRAGGEFTRIWNAEQAAVIRFLAEATQQRVANLEAVVADANKALCELGSRLDAIAGDAAAARAHAEITERLLRADLDLPLNLKSGLSTEGWRRFAAHNPAIPFRGRQDELDALRGFLGDPRPFAWWIVTGSGGSGKTRLALELCLRAHADGWRGGFLRRFNQNESWSLSLAWQPAAPTLIIADYASEQVARISALALRLHEQSQASPSGWPVRLLLLERRADALFERRFTGATAGDSGAILAHRHAAAPLAVPELSDDDIWDMVQHCPWRGDGAHLTMPREAFFTRLAELDAERRALVAMILAEASVASPGGSGFGTLEQELRDLIERDRVSQWPTALGCAGKPVGSTEADVVIAFATMVDGAGETELAALAKARGKPVEGDILEDCARAMGQKLNDAVQRLGRIEPDLIGEFFALETLRQRPFAAPPHAWLPETAWRTNEAAMAAFVVRARQNFPSHPALRRVEVIVPGQTESWWLAASRSAAGAASLDDFLTKARDALAGAAPVDPGAAGALGRLTEFATGQETGVGVPELRDGLVTLLLQIGPLHPDNAGLRRSLAIGLVNTLNHAKAENALDRRDALLDELRALAARHPDDAAVREHLARGLFNTLNHAKAEDALDRRDALLDELRALAACHPDDAAVREQLAMGLVNTLNDAKAEDALDRRDALLDEVRAVAARYPDDAAVRGVFAVGLLVARLHAAQEGGATRANRLLDELRALAGAFPDDATVAEMLRRASEEQ